MASKKFQRKIREVAAQVMKDSEEYRAGVAGQAGAGATAKAGGQSGGAQLLRVGATASGGMFNALAILTDQNVYLIRTPLLKAYEVKDVVLTAPIGTVEIVDEHRNRLRIGDYRLTYTFKMGSEAKHFAELASQASPQ